MPDLETLMRSVSPPSAAPPAPASPVRLTLIAAALFALVGGAVSLEATLTRNLAVRCALPAGIRIEALTPREQALAVRHAMACSDVEHGRIGADQYLATLAALDAAALPPAQPEAPPAMIWAASVREMSSQYTLDRWSAARALGPPDVATVGQDNANAWASLGADDRVEHLEVALARPAHLSAVEVFETFNPGAVSEVVLIGESGQRTLVRRDVANGRRSQPYASRFALPSCTEEPIVAIRVTVDSPRVAGWNEIDAIGGQPCQ